MAYTSDGSIVCDSDRSALAVVDADFTLLTAKTVPVIFGAGIHGVSGDRMRADASGSFTLHWRRTGGSFAAVTSTSEVKIHQAAGGTVLANGTAVSLADAQCNASATFIAGGVEIEAAATTTTTPLIEFRDAEGGEWQIALDFSGALDNQQYEFRGVCVHDAGTTNIDFAAAITTPAGGGGVATSAGIATVTAVGQAGGIIQLRPSADVSLGSWTSTGADLFSVLDEAVASDADSITSAATPSNDVSEVALHDPVLINAGTATIRVRVKKT